MELVAYPALQAKMGDWTYYVTSMTMKELAETVHYAHELYPSNVMWELIQRALTDRKQGIANYLLSQPQRFFGSIIVAATNGAPQFTNVKVVDPTWEYTKIGGLGLLTFDGTQKYFALDGQHRLSAIKMAVKEKPELEQEQVSIIIVQHKHSDAGKVRTRRLFTTLNRYAKAISKQDVVAMDEDDAAAILTRRLVFEGYPLFQKQRLSASKSKAISPKNTAAFTNAITVYDVNEAVLRGYGWPMTKKFKQNRPEAKTLDRMYQELLSFWDGLSSTIKPVRDIMRDADAPISEKYRSSEGGHLVFRPIGLTALARAFELGISQKVGAKTLWQRISKVDFDLNSAPWKGVLWHAGERKMMYAKGLETLASQLLAYKIRLEVNEGKLGEEYNKVLAPQDQAAKVELPPQVKD